jgi:hypothetical protein
VLLWCSYVLWALVWWELLLVLELWLQRIAGWSVARKRMVSLILSLLFCPSLLVLVLVVLMAEVAGSHDLQAAEDHDVTVIVL